MKKLLLLLLAGAAFLPALVLNPVIDTDKSVNTTSVQTIVADLIKPSMSDMDKLKALFTFHRRMMHHYRFLQTAEDGSTAFDPIKMYTVYGSSFCTQQASIFHAMCSMVFGWGGTRDQLGDNAEGTAGSGILRTSGLSGGHSSFHVRFNPSDKWHWIDPIVGAYALNKTDGTIASEAEILADPSILADAEKDGRASTPFFACTKGPNPIDSTIPSAYSYYDYDSVFIRTYMAAQGPNQYTNAYPYFTTRKTLKKGEKYIFYWDFITGDYFNLHDTVRSTDGITTYTRDWKWFPPRDLCGWKDSLDTKNWPYFKPYKKVIKGDTCYRYYANGIHTYEPDLKTAEPKDGTYSLRNTAFYADNGAGPGIHPSRLDSLCEVAWRIKIPYPLMSMRLSGIYIKKNAGDSLSISMKRLRFVSKDDVNKSNETYPNYRDTLTADTNYKLIKSFAALDSAVFDTSLRTYVDPLYTGRAYQGYLVKLTMRGRQSITGLGFTKLKVECVFQHNMFALPQFEPGANIVTISSDSSNLANENLKVAFSWMDNGEAKTSLHSVVTAPESYTVTVNQAAMPKMLFMGFANSVNAQFEPDAAEKKAAAVTLAGEPMAVSPNPFGSNVAVTLRNPLAGKPGLSVRIYDSRGRLIETLCLESGGKSTTWSAVRFPPAVYIVRASAGSYSAVRKILLVK